MLIKCSFSPKRPGRQALPVSPYAIQTFCRKTGSKQPVQRTLLSTSVLTETTCLFAHFTQITLVSVTFVTREVAFTKAVAPLVLARRVPSFRQTL